MEFPVTELKCKLLCDLKLFHNLSVLYRVR